MDRASSDAHLGGWMIRRGWHSRGYLPHCDAESLVQHVVFRLKDSLPGNVTLQLRLLGKVQRLHQIDAALDLGHGAKTLAIHEAAQVVVDALHHFDGDRYRLIAWCVMPTHVHVVVEPLLAHSFGSIVKSWKAYSATQINRLLGRSGSLWAADYFDRFMRDNDQLSTTIAYVEANPVAAKLVETAVAWPFSSASVRVMRV